MTTPTWKNPIVKWIDYRLPIFTFMKHETVDYPTPKNLNYWWNYGSLAGIALVIMIASGVFLAMSYTPHVDSAFDSIERIMRDVNYGWLLRYIHMNAGSMFFLCVYIHIFRGLYFGSYKNPREILWILGVIIYLIMMASAFMGYVLVWGQMSFWGATAITNLFSAIPLVGDALVTLLWGGFSIANPTLNRFFSLHYLLPFIICALVFLHLWALHAHKSNNPLGVEIQGPGDTIPFHPYYTMKDAYGLGLFMVIFLFFVFFSPDFFGEPDNYIEANPLVTPTHIVPEWYLLPFYAILRAFTVDYFFFIPFSWLMSAKLAGVIAMFASILVLLFLPWLDTSKVRSATFRPIYKQVYWLFVIDVIALGYVGAKPPDGWLVPLGQWATFYYFAHFLVVIPLIGIFEKPRPLPESISAAVVTGDKTSQEAS